MRQSGSVAGVKGAKEVNLLKPKCAEFCFVFCTHSMDTEDVHMPAYQPATSLGIAVS